MGREDPAWVTRIGPDPVLGVPPDDKVVVVVGQVGADLDEESSQESGQGRKKPKPVPADRPGPCPGRPGPRRRSGSGAGPPGSMPARRGISFRPGVPPGRNEPAYQGSHGYFRKFGFRFSM